MDVNILDERLWAALYRAHPEHLGREYLLRGDRIVHSTTLRAFIKWCAATQGMPLAQARHFLDLVDTFPRVGDHDDA